MKWRGGYKEGNKERGNHVRKNEMEEGMEVWRIGEGMRGWESWVREERRK